MIPVVVLWNTAEPGSWVLREEDEEGSGEAELEEAEGFELEEVGMTIDDATAEKTWSQTVSSKAAKQSAE